MAPAQQTLTVESPSEKEIAAYPREYALFRQLDHTHSGKIPLEEATQYVKKYGSSSVELKAGKMPFEELAKAFHKQGSAEGKGNALGYAARDSDGHLSSYSFDRRALKDDDVCIQITHCGICHSDLHQIKNEWGNASYPMVPGHEVVGIVTAVGPKVQKFKVGDRAGVGCMVDSCAGCGECKDHEEQYCPKSVLTYNAKGADGVATQGGYSTHMVVKQSFVLHVPENLPLDAAAPLLCAGITVYSPLMHYGLNKPGMKVGVIGLGGLGHVAVKIGKAMGLEVTVFSTSEGKKDEALKTLGADHFVISKDEEQMQAIAGSLDGIIDTVAAKHPIAPYLATTKKAGSLVMLGVPAGGMQDLPVFSILSGRRKVGGSMIGGIKETQAMLDFCSKHNIVCDIESIKMDYVNQAMERLVKNDVHYRFVIDVQGSLIL